MALDFNAITGAEIRELFFDWVMHQPKEQVMQPQSLSNCAVAQWWDSCGNVPAYILQDVHYWEEDKSLRLAKDSFMRVISETHREGRFPNCILRAKTFGELQGYMNTMSHMWIRDEL